MATNTIGMQLAKKSGMRNRVKGLTEVEDGNISAEAGIQGPGPIVDRKNELRFTREARSKTPCCLGVRILLVCARPLPAWRLVLSCRVIGRPPHGVSRQWPVVVRYGMRQALACQADF